VKSRRGGLSVKIADLDLQQRTSENWGKRRAVNGIEPVVRVESFSDVRTALSEAKQFDVYILDGAPHASRDTRIVAEAADLVVIPTSDSDEDLEPSVLLAHDLAGKGIPAERIVFALCMVSDSVREVLAAQSYLEKTAYRVLEGDVPFRTGFRKALARGQAITETPFPTLVARADRLAQSMIDAAAKSAERQAA